MAINPTVGARTALTVSGMSTLASATYAVSSAYNCNANKPVDVVVDVSVATTNAPTGNKKMDVFVKESIDGTNFRSGPESGTVTTDENGLTPLGTIKVNLTANAYRGLFSIAQTLGYVPHSFKIVVRNDFGVAATSGDIYTSEITVP